MSPIRRILVAVTLVTSLAACATRPTAPLGTAAPGRACDLVETVAEGHGPTRADALDDAARQAVSESLGEYVTYQASLVDEAFSESLGVVSRGAVASVTVVSERTVADGTRLVRARIGLCRNRMPGYSRVETVTSKDVMQMDQRVSAFLDDVSSRKRAEERARREFSEALSAILTPAFTPNGIYRVELLDYEIRLVEDRVTHARVVVTLRMGLEPTIRDDLMSLIEHVAVGKRGPFGNPEKRVREVAGGFAEVLGRYPDAWEGSRESYLYGSLYELSDWQSEQLVAELKSANRLIDDHAMLIAGEDQTGAPLFSVAINRRFPDRFWSKQRGLRIPADRISVFPYRLFGQTTAGIDYVKGAPGARDLSPFTILKVGTRSVPGLRQFDRQIRVEFSLPLALARRLGRVYLPVMDVSVPRLP
jgi:hypothetical protein